VEKPARRAAGPQTILLVEDEQSLRKLTRSTLVESGYTVLEAADAPEALEIVRRSDFHMDLLLTDIVMPGMSGHELAAQLSPQCPDMKVLFMSGYTEGAVATHGVLKPGVKILRKPFSRVTLAKYVAEVLAEKHCGSAPGKDDAYAEAHEYSK
jgi:two-component system, cell cycle sensor histidine kinase and response regulator CckA